MKTDVSAPITSALLYPKLIVTVGAHEDMITAERLMQRLNTSVSM